MTRWTTLVVVTLLVLLAPLPTLPALANLPTTNLTVGAVLAEEAKTTVIYKQTKNKESVNMFLDFFKRKVSEPLAAKEDKEIKKLEATVYAGIILADHEDYVARAYHATADERKRGIFTVGFGETQGVKNGDSMDYHTACAKLKAKITEHIDRLTSWKPDLFTAFTPAQVAALVSLLYNVGEGNFRGGATFQAFLKGDVNGIIKNGFDPEKGFVKQSGRILKGLVTRRGKEVTLLLADSTIKRKR
jgi:GH24 family phage-related lysozyme (muramidase)